jgi:hypothetical protein
MKFLGTLMVVVIFVSVSGFVVTSTNASAASCGLTGIQISMGGQTSGQQQQVIITASPSCWSGSVGINRGNVDTNLISVSVKNGAGSGQITMIDTTQEVHPYASNPGLRGNNIIIPCGCTGTGLTKLSISNTGSKVTITATPSTWAGSVEIVTSTGTQLASVSVPSSPGHYTVSNVASEAGVSIHAVYSGIVSNSISLP